ncbi:MAG TPA: PIN domain-containing protein [Campylobacterales bacterium]|nr:PIN domain-containing protein [Campylobacterales bacterium]
MPTILELEEVMFRGKHKERIAYLNDEDKYRFIDDIVFISHPVRLNYLWRPYLKDAKDDKILESAFNASAKYIVTYNLKDFEGVKKDFDIKIITPRAYLKEKGLV